MEMTRIFSICITLGMILSGCAMTSEKVDRLFLGDTVVNIPLKPEPTGTLPPETVSAAPEETAAPTLSVPTDTQPVATAPSSKSSYTQSTSKKSSSTGTSSSKKQTKATTPPATEPPVASVAATEPLSTEAPPTELSETLPPESEPYAGDTLPANLDQDVLAQINIYRTSAGVNALSADTALCGAASTRACEVCLSWSHTRPNGSEWQSILAEWGCNYSVSWEALVHTSGFDAAAIVSKWMENPDTQANLLSPDFTAIGVGVYYGDETAFLAAILAG